MVFSGTPKTRIFQARGDIMFRQSLFAIIGMGCLISGCERGSDVITFVTVTGRILDSEGVPIELAEIRIAGFPSITSTGNDGRFNAQVETGPHRLTVNKDGLTLLQFTFIATSPGPTMLGDLQPTTLYFVSAQNWYKDADGDGYSDGSTIVQNSQPEAHYLPNDLIAIAGDCDDTNADLNPRTSETCGHDELIDLYIKNWYHSKVVADADALRLRSQAVNWEQFDQPVAGELVNEPRFASASGWVLLGGSEINDGLLILPPNSSARTDDLPVINQSTPYWTRMWVRWEGGDTIPGSGFQAEIIRRASDRSFINRKKIPAEGEIHPIPSLPNGSDWNLIESPVQLTENTSYLRMILHNNSEDSTFYVKLASVSEFSMLDIQNEGSMAMPLLISREDLPMTHTLRVKLENGPSIAIDSVWRVTANGEPLSASATENPDGTFSLEIGLPATDSRRINLLIDPAEGLRGYGQVGILDQTDPLLIGFVTDQHYYFRARQWAPRYRDIMDSTIDQLNAHQPDLVFFIGDHDEDNQPLGNIFHDFGRLHSPLVVAYGNHEKDNQDVSKVKKYLSRKQTYFDFVVGKYHFIIIDGNELSLDGGHKNTLMSPVQLAWLDSVLNNSTAATKIVVSEPAIVFRNGSSWDRSFREQAVLLHSMFVTSGVRIVVQGDKHQYDHQIRDGVEYLTLPSVTRPFGGDLRAGYGLMLLKQGDVAWANMVETFEQDISDSHAPVAWSMVVQDGIAMPSGHMPVFHYKKPTLQIRRANEILEIEAINHLGRIFEVPVKMNNGDIQLFQIPDNGETAVFGMGIQ